MPFIVFYFFESLLIALFVSVCWNLVIYPTINFYLTYFQWVILIWIIKIVFQNIFTVLQGTINLLTNINNYSNILTNNNEKNEIQ